MPPENLHITLAFLGQVDAAQFDAIVAAARGVQARRFTLRLDEPGYWTHNHIAWLGATKAPEELKVMVAELRAALVQAGISFDPKPFVPHVTLVLCPAIPRAGIAVPLEVIARSAAPAGRPQRGARPYAIRVGGARGWLGGAIVRGYDESAPCRDARPRTASRDGTATAAVTAIRWPMAWHARQRSSS